MYRCHRIPTKGMEDSPSPDTYITDLRFKLSGTDVVKRFAKKVHFYSWIGFSSVANLLLLWYIYFFQNTKIFTPHCLRVDAPSPPRQRKTEGSRGGSQVVSMVIPLVENTIVSNEKAEGKATKRSTKGRIRDLGKSGGCLFHISTKCLSLRVRTVTAVIHLINSPRVINFVR